MLIKGPEICHVGRCPHGCKERCDGHAWRALAPAHYAGELANLIKRAERDGVVLPMVRDAKRWGALSEAMAEASACDHSVGGHPFFQALERVAGTKMRRFTPEEFGAWVDVAGEEWKASRPAMQG
ncbi:MAG TPA: hypothetical protein VMS38_28750 [Pseudorhodoferax sp.]|nr:hypothetical protein [Pseudorhodoferax sp.]